ncbi:MAG: amidase family protein [Alphaproteobacteria bacterium]|jgi:amidase|nr:amidase family protein [Alphaproteobacteria bacterium]MDP6565321.1 amidase family protein [Alphaproteobacteria bacterium]MDP6814157.1 amidase family protein [Alphaproteobacteria bacterium]
MTSDLWQWSAVETAAAIRQGKVSCAEAVDAALSRLAEVNQPVNAVTVDLSVEAREAATRADAVVHSGVALGPLHGVPITIKENVDQAGQSNPNGVPAFEEIVADQDSPIVANLRKAGAIIIGRTNTPEFSLRWFTDNPLRGLTMNPWHDGVTPGGSSGGAAAAVVLGIGDIAHGNDLGGSLRYPAYACGVATIRPSFGRVPSFNPSGAEERPPTLQLMAVQGPIAREVRDVRLALAAMAQADTRDPWWVPAPLQGPAPATPIRVAATKAPAGIACHEAVARAIDDAAGHLSNAGYAVEAVDPPLMAEIAECWRTLLMTDTRVMTEASIQEFGSEDIKQVLDHYMAASNTRDLNGYVRALADRTRLLRAWSQFMEDYPLVLAPVSQVPPFPQLEDLGGAARVKRMLDEQSMLYGVNVLGLPSAAVPTGLADGVPTGVQIIGPRLREDLCLDAAEAVERGVGVLARRLWERT